MSLQKICLALSISLVAASAQEVPSQGSPPPDATAKKPEVERISETQFKVGKVSFNTDKKEISFPGKINMTNGLLEYLIVMPHGKMHESLIVTDANPFDINVALKLLSIPSLPNFFPEMDENFNPIPRPPIPESKQAASRMECIVSWEKDGKSVTCPLHKLIQNNETKKTILKGRLLYTGSVIENGKFIATLTGDIAGILNNKASLLNYDGPDSENDEIWVPVSEKIPELGTDLTITLKPVNGPEKAKDDK